MRKQLIAVILLVGALAAPFPSGADVSVNVNIGPPPPVVVTTPPVLVAVPAVPMVQYVPTLGADLFFFGGHWYYWHGGHWFLASSYQGPWTFIVAERVPRPILAVPAQYYKVPPGHLNQLAGPPGHAKGKGKGRD